MSPFVLKLEMPLHRNQLPTPLVRDISEPPPEKFVTLRSAAETLGVPMWKLARAAKQELFPAYTVFNSRLLVKLSEVIAASARHSFISNLQAVGIEVATVAKLAGHANPVTTLNVYSHAVRGSAAAAVALESAYAC